MISFKEAVKTAEVACMNHNVPKETVMLYLVEIANM